MSRTTQLLQSATAHHQAGQLDDAEKAYRELLENEGSHKEATRLLGTLYLQKGQFEPAFSYLEKAAQLAPQNPEIFTNLGITLKKLGKIEEAVLRFRAALGLREDYLPALQNLANIFYEKHQIEEALPLYQKIVALSPKEPSAHFNCANMLFVSHRPEEAIKSYEEALKLKPDYVEAMINLGIALSQGRKNEKSSEGQNKAQALFEKALATNPSNPVALNNMATLFRQKGQPEKAVTYCREALRLRPDYVEAAVNLGTSLRDLNLVEEAIQSCEVALSLRPDFPEALINLGVFRQDRMQHEKAIELFDRVLKQRPSSLDALWNKSLSLLALGHYEEAWPLHEKGLGVLHMRGIFPDPAKRWKGEDIQGKRLLIRCEQGLGDSLQFIRYAALCKQQAATVLVLAPPSLHRLLRNCPFIDDVLDVEGLYDYHVAMMSLPFIFSTKIETIPASIPYLFVSEKTQAQWAQKFTDQKGFKVGLVWAGNSREHMVNAHLADKRRSLHLEMLRPLFDIKDVQFYNLQMGEKRAQIKSCCLEDKIVDLMGEVKDFEDTAAIIEHLDLVISVDTSVVHLAGGLGKQVWVMSRFDACWRWLQNSSESPWYPTARIFGQKTFGDWTGVIEQLKLALIDKTKG